MEGKFLNIIKAMYDKPIANIIQNGEQLEPFLLMQEQDAHSPHSYSI
jgi:hypothetical protein